MIRGIKINIFYFKKITINNDEEKKKRDLNFCENCNGLIDESNNKYKNGQEN